MKIKKILFICLALVLITTLCACGSSKSKKNEADPNAVQAQRWAIAIDYGYPDEETNEQTNPQQQETTDPEQGGETQQPVDPTGITEPEETVIEPQPSEPTDPDNGENTPVNPEEPGNNNPASADPLKDAIKAYVGLIVAALIFCVVALIANWKIFSMAGRPGWKSLVPILNLYTQFEIIYGKGILFLLLLIPIFGLIKAIKANIALAKVYGYGIGVGLLCVFLAPIGYAFIAFNPKSEYVGPTEF